MFRKLKYWLLGLQISFWQKLHPCRLGWKEYDHDMTFVDDSFDYEGPFGLSTHRSGHWECEHCGFIPEEQDPPPEYDDFYDI